MAGGSNWWGDGFSIRSTHGCLEWTCGQDGPATKPTEPDTPSDDDGDAGAFVGTLFLVAVAGLLRFFGIAS